MPRRNCGDWRDPIFSCWQIPEVESLLHTVPNLLRLPRHSNSNLHNSWRRGVLTNGGTSQAGCTGSRFDQSISALRPRTGRWAFLLWASRSMTDWLTTLDRLLQAKSPLDMTMFGCAALCHRDRKQNLSVCLHKSRPECRWISD